MRVFSSVAEVPGDFGPSAVTIGKFDGVHLGHRRMLDRLLEDARRDSLVPTVLTFDRNPLSVLAPEKCPPPLASNEQKIELLAGCGLAATVMLAFDRAFSELPAEDFIETVLIGALRARIVCVGPDFRFGHRGTGDLALLEETGLRRGFTVQCLPAVEREGRRVSSSWIRELLTEGRVGEAASLLGRYHRMRGTVARGARRGRELGFPTANLAPDAEGLVPADGVYAAWAVVDGRRHPAAVSIGNNPTFEGVPARQVEAHLLSPDFGPIELELYGESIELEFVDRIRGMERFDTVEQLTERIAEDVRTVRAVLEQARDIP